MRYKRKTGNTYVLIKRTIRIVCSTGLNIYLGKKRKYNNAPIIEKLIG